MGGCGPAAGFPVSLRRQSWSYDPRLPNDAASLTHLRPLSCHSPILVRGGTPQHTLYPAKGPVLPRGPGRSPGKKFWPPNVIAPPPPAVRAGGAGGLVLPEETAAHASETLAYSGICVRHGITRLGRPPSKASSPLAHQFCVFLSSSSARCCPAVPEPLLEPSTWPGAVIIGVRALALAPYLEPRGVYFILVLSSRARRPRTTREVRASHPAPALACA